MLHGIYQILQSNVIYKYQRSKKKHENTVQTIENDSTLTPTTYQMHYLKSNLEIADLRDCNPLN